MKAFVVSSEDIFLSLIFLTNSEGKGSIHFKSKIIFGENERTIRKFPVYFYLEEDNFTKKYFSGYNFNVMPSNIKAYADIDPRCSSLTYQQIQDWEAPDWCSETLCPDGTSPPCGTIPYIIIPPIDIPTKKEEQSCDNFKVDLDNVCRINRTSSTKTTNGMVLHAYVGVDSDILEHDNGYNVNRVFVAEDEKFFEY